MRTASCSVVVPFAPRPAKKNGRFNLRARDRRGELNCLQRSAVDGHRRMAVGQVQARAHLLQRPLDALHRPLGERRITHKRVGAGMRRYKPGQHAHGRAGVAAVKIARGLPECAANARHFDHTVRPFLRPLRRVPPCRRGNCADQHRSKSWRDAMCLRPIRQAWRSGERCSYRPAAERCLAPCERAARSVWWIQLQKTYHVILSAVA